MNWKCVATIGLCLMACLSLDASAANLVSNGSFEDPGGGNLVPNPPGISAFYITGWEVYTGDIDYIPPTTWTASDPVMSLDLHGFNAGGIRQTIATVLGETYKVIFDMAANPSGSTLKELRVSAAGSSAQFTFDRTGKTTTNMGWETKGWSFVATSTSTVLSFESVGSYPSNAGPALDNVRVSPSPLTYTWREGTTVLAGPSTIPTEIVSLSLGSHTIDLEVSDGLATDSDQVLVDVVDTTPPQISLNGPNPQDVECPGPYNELSATVSDACDSNPTLTISSGSGNFVDGVLSNPSQFSGSETVIDFEGFANGTLLTTQLASQGVTFLLDNGQASQVTFDSNPRQFGPGGNLGIHNFPFGSCQNLVMTFSSPINRVALEIRNNTADDLNLSLTCLSSGQVVGTQFFVTDLSYKFVGIESSAGFDQVIVDVTGNSNGCMIMDNLRFEGGGGGGVDPTTPGTYVITYTASDADGNTATATRTVIVKDTTAPVVTMNGDSLDSVECGDAYTDPGATANDACDGDLAVTTIDSVDTSTPGSYPIIYSATDAEGNTGSATRIVVVVDTTPPVVTMNGDSLKVECGGTYTDPGATANDACDGDLAVTTLDSVDTSTPGTYNITYTATDAAGNTGSATRIVVVQDTTPPVPDAASLPDATGECSATVSGPPTATDNCEGPIIGTTTDDLTSTTQGTSVVTWTFDDGNGNTSTQTQNIVVDDVTAPVPDAASLPDATGECSATIAAPPTATDNCAGAITGTTTDALTSTTQGTSVVTWTFDDGNGNTSTQTQNIVVNDVTAPVADLPSLPDATGECSATISGPPTATDNCAGTIIGTTADALTSTTQGTSVVTWTFDDGNGNTTTQTQNIVVDDVTAPVADLASLPDATGECSATIAASPTATDNCSGAITGTTTDALTRSTQGTSVVTWTYDDGNGNTTTQTQNIVVDDLTGPVPDAVSLADATGECSATIGASPTATDNCAGTVTGTTTDALTRTTQGTSVVTWTFDDGNGNTSTQTQNIVVDDLTAPVPDAVSLPDATGECSATISTAPTATDNCSGTVTGTTTDALTRTTQGTSVVTWTYDDGNGNTSTQTQNIVVDDITDPVPDLSSLPDATGECSASIAGPPTATDNCAGAITGTTTDALTRSTQGTSVVTWTFDDGNGNTSTQTQNIVVDDLTAPVPDAVSLPDATGECLATIGASPTATDNCSGAITGTTTDALTRSTQGTSVVTWTYDDGNGNTSTQTQNIVVNDVTAPVADLASLPDATGECSATIGASPTATDNCAGAVTATTTDDLTRSTQGTSVVTWTFDDGNGNTSTQTQNIVVDDVTAPVPDAVSLPDATGECSATIGASPTATDNCSGAITGTTTDDLTRSTQGTSVVTWTFDDGNGNTSTQTQNIVVNDVTAPVADLPSLPDATGECSATIGASPTATDNCSGTIIGTTTDDLTRTTQGASVVTWTFDDGNGNTSTQTQNIVVDDITDPVPDLSSLPDATGECSASIAGPPTATDNCAGAITGTTSDQLAYSTQGTFTVTWTFDDGNGNTSTQTQNIIVDDITAPVADLPSLPDATGQCSATITAPPTATDNCAGAITGSTNDPLTRTTQGTSVVTWTFDDGNGNTSTQTQNIVVEDTTPPVITGITLDQNVLWPPNHKYRTITVSITATDNCNSPVAISGTIVSDEPDEDKTGDGKTTGDIKVTSGEDVFLSSNEEPEVAFKAGDGLELRCERKGDADGRVYTITVIATDASGNISPEETAEVTVPHDQGNGKGKGKNAKLARIGTGSRDGLGADLDPLGGSPDVRFALDSNEPLSFRLDQNYPNPFNPETTIRYSVPEASEVRLIIYNIQGQQVRVLINAPHSAGRYNTRWDGRDEIGRSVSTGVYVYRLEAGTNVALRKMVFVK